MQIGTVYITLMCTRPRLLVHMAVASAAYTYSKQLLRRTITAGLYAVLLRTMAIIRSIPILVSSA